MLDLRRFILVGGLALGLIGTISPANVAAQTESATAEDGAPASEAPAETTTAPNVPLGANLTPPLGVNDGIVGGIAPPAGTGQSGTSSVSMAPGTLTSGTAREGRNAVRAPEGEPAAAPASEAPAVPTCADYPTWYDAQLALESATDAALVSSLDPDGNAIACEEVMYP